MLIRNAVVDGYAGLVDLRMMHGAVQEIGAGLVKGLYESELDLQGDTLRPGRRVVQPGVTAAMLRRLYREGVALIITDVTPAGRISPASPRIEVCCPLPETAPEETHIRPGTAAPLCRWSRENVFISVIDEHSAD